MLNAYQESIVEKLLHPFVFQKQLIVKDHIALEYSEIRPSPYFLITPIRLLDGSFVYLPL